MKSEKEHHWTENEERLADYVLGRIEAAELPPLLNHLDVCSACRDTVEREQYLVASIKLTGRKNLKARLSQRLGETRSSVPWPRVLAVAATVVILVGVGVYNTWFMGKNEEERQQLFSHSQKTETTPSQSGKAGDVITGKDIPEETTGRERTISEKRVTQQPQEEFDARSKNKRAEGISLDEEHSRPSLSMESDKKEAPVVPPSPAADLSIPAEEGQWLRGNVIQQEKEDLESTLRDQPRSRAPATGQAKVATPDDAQTLRTSQTIVIRQTVQPQLQQFGKRYDSSGNSVRALITQSADSVEIMLFPEIPFQQEDLDHASFRQVHRDSFVVQIGGQEIGFHVPGGIPSAGSPRR